jgi:hypothetical protein
MNQVIRTVKIKGKDYVDVAERVRLANCDDGFSMLEEQYLEIAGVPTLRVVIEVKGKRYIGDAEIKIGAKPGTADGDSPVSCAQTSALGRALGFAGYGSLESIASADEIHRTVENRPQTVTDRLNALYARGKGSSWANKEEFLGFISRELGLEIIEPGTLTFDHMSDAEAAFARISGLR